MLFTIPWPSDNAVCLKAWAFLYLNQIQIIIFSYGDIFPNKLGELLNI